VARRAHAGAAGAVDALLVLLRHHCIEWHVVPQNSSVPETWTITCGADDRDGPDDHAQRDEREETTSERSGCAAVAMRGSAARAGRALNRLRICGISLRASRWRRWNVDDRHGRLEGRIAQRDLALAGEVDRLAEDARGLLRRVESGRVSRLDEIQDRTASDAADRAPAPSSASFRPAALAAFRSSISATTAVIAFSRSAQCLSWISYTRACRSSAVAFSSCFL
jgi:hypothetical protein